MDDRNGKAATSSLLQTTSLSGSGNSTPELAVSKARQLFGCFRGGDANDPETYVAAISAVLAQYAPHVVHSVCDPRTGLPSESNFLPTVKEVRDACELIHQREARAYEREDRERVQLEERRRLDAVCGAQAPPEVAAATRSALCARFGIMDIPRGYDAVDITRLAHRHGAGLQAEIDRITALGQGAPGLFERVVENAKAARNARMEEANKAAFDAERKAAGIDPATATVSPSLAKLIAAKVGPS